MTELSILTATHFEDGRDQSLQMLLNSRDSQKVVCGYWKREGFVPIVSVSSQLGCSVGCWQFCSIPKFQRDLTITEISGQVDALLAELARVGKRPAGRFKISFVKEGEPLLNRELPAILEALAARYDCDFKLSTTLPVKPSSDRTLADVVNFASQYQGDFQLQVSMASTDPLVRQRLVRHPVMPFDGLRAFGQEWVDRVGTNQSVFKRILLSFTIYEETVCDPELLRRQLPPELFVARVRDASPKAGLKERITRLSQERFDRLRHQFEAAGYLFIDGRSADLAVSNQLTMGLYKIKNVLGTNLVAA